MTGREYWGLHVNGKCNSLREIWSGKIHGMSLTSCIMCTVMVKVKNFIWFVRILLFGLTTKILFDFTGDCGSSITDFETVKKRLNKDHQFWKQHESQSSTNSVTNQNIKPQTRQATYLTNFCCIVLSSPLGLIQEWYVYCAKVIYVHTGSLLWCHVIKENQFISSHVYS